MSEDAMFTMKLEPEWRDAFMAEAKAGHSPASQIERKVMREFVERQRQAREYDACLRAKVATARAQISSGQFANSADVEARFTAREGRWIQTSPWADVPPALHLCRPVQDRFPAACRASPDQQGSGSSGRPVPSTAAKLRPIMSHWLVALILSLLIPMSGFADQGPVTGMADSHPLQQPAQSMQASLVLVDALLDALDPVADDAAIEAAADSLIDAPELFGAAPRVPLLALPAVAPHPHGRAGRPAPVLDGPCRPPRATLR